MSPRPNVILYLGVRVCGSSGAARINLRAAFIFGGDPLPKETLLDRRAKAGILSKRDVAAVEAVCEGLKTRTQIAEEFGMSKERLRKLMKRRDVKVYIDGWTEEMLRTASVKASKVLIDQLDSSNQWVAQNAARTILQFMRDQNKTDELNITVTFTGGMPTPGMPSPKPIGDAIEAEGAVE